MPHYANGREAKVGDLVVGKGYNVLDENRQLKTIMGFVTAITRGAKACNLQVMYGLMPAKPNEDGNFGGNPMFLSGYAYWPRIEHGQADHFLHAEDAGAAEPVHETVQVV